MAPESISSRNESWVAFFFFNHLQKYMNNKASVEYNVTVVNFSPSAAIQELTP